MIATEMHEHIVNQYNYYRRCTESISTRWHSSHGMFETLRPQPGDLAITAFHSHDRAVKADVDIRREFSIHPCTTILAHEIREVQVSNESFYITHLVSNAATVRTGDLMLCIGLSICPISTCLVGGEIMLCFLASADLSGRTRFEETLCFAALEPASAPCSSCQLHPFSP